MRAAVSLMVNRDHIIERETREEINRHRRTYEEEEGEEENKKGRRKEKTKEREVVQEGQAEEEKEYCESHEEERGTRDTAEKNVQL